MQRFINLEAIIQGAKDGHYENGGEIYQEFRSIIKDVNKAKRLALEAFYESNDCEHEFDTCWYTIRKNLFGEFFYMFERSCSKCGKKEMFRCEVDSEYNETNPPEGYEGAQRRFYNNDI